MANAMSAQEIDDTRRLLADSVGNFIGQHPGPARVRALRDNSPGFDRTVWRAAADAGWFGLRLPEAIGGMGLGVGELAIVMEGLGRNLAPEPVAASVVLAGGVLMRMPPSPLRDEKLAALAAGNLLPAFAWQDAANSYDPTQTTTVAVADGGTVRLTGRKCFVVPADAADGFLVTSRDADGMAIYWLDRHAAGLSLTLDAAVDGSRIGTLSLDGTEVPAAHRLGDAPAALLDEALDEARLAVTAELIGVMSYALDITLDYVRSRTQFGVAIGSFQALQHRLVDLWMQRELAKASLARALRSFDGPPRERALAVSAAKARASNAGQLIGRQGIQLHGGMGYTDACDIGLCLKRAVVLAAFLGNATMQRRRYASLSDAKAA